MIRHRAKALETACTRTEVGHLADLLDHPLLVHRLPAVDVEQVLVAKVGGIDQFTGRPVVLPQDGKFPHREDRLAAIVVDENTFERLVHIVRVTRDVLEVPLQLARPWVQCQRRVGIERVAGGATRCACPRFGLRGAPKNETGIGVEAAWNPGIAARPKHDRQVTPRVAAPFSRQGNG